MELINQTLLYAKELERIVVRGYPARRDYGRRDF